MIIRMDYCRLFIVYCCFAWPTFLTGLATFYVTEILRGMSRTDVPIKSMHLTTEQ